MEVSTWSWFFVQFVPTQASSDVDVKENLTFSMRTVFSMKMWKWNAIWNNRLPHALCHSYITEKNIDIKTILGRIPLPTFNLAIIYIKRVFLYHAVNHTKSTNQKQILFVPSAPSFLWRQLFLVNRYYLRSRLFLPSKAKMTSPESKRELKYSWNRMLNVNIVATKHGF